MARMEARQSILGVVPLLIIPVVVYAVLNMTSGTGFWGATLFSVPMVSGGNWVMSYGDALVTISLFVLFFELLYSTRTGTITIYNHIFSFLVFIGALIAFLMFSGFSTSTFFFIMVMALIDVLAGFIITTVTARRDLGIAPGILE